jgi:NADH-quinone oxidoreductase subunit N
MGYLLVAMMYGDSAAVQAVAFYLTAYTITTLGAFGIIGVISPSTGDADDMEAFRGLALAHPWLGAAFTGMLLSLAGIPLTAGFVGKFYLVAAGLHNALWLPVMVLLVTSGIGLYYYLRIVVVLFSRPQASPASSYQEPVVGLSGGLALSALCLLLVWLGIAPEPLLSLIQGITG